MMLDPREPMIISGVSVFNQTERYQMKPGDWRYNPLTGKFTYKKGRRASTNPRTPTRKVKAILFMYDVIV